MSNNLEPTVFSKLETLSHRLYSVPSVCISCDILKDTLHSNFKSGAAISKHIIEMWLEAVVRSCLESDCNALGLALL